MIDTEASVRYGRALFQMAEERSETDRIQEEIRTFCQLIGELPKMRHLFLNSIVSPKEKKEFLQRILSGKTTPLFLNFLKVLVAKQRFGEIDLMEKEFRALYEKKKGLQAVEVSTAVALSEKVMEKLTAMLKTRLRAEIRLVTKIEPELLGGILIRFNNMEIDASYRYRFDTLRQTLMTS